VPDVAALNVVISADTSNLEAGLSRAEQSVSKAGSAIQAAMGGALVAGIAGVGAAMVGSVKSAADFEKQMSAVGAVAGASASEMEALTKTALQLGKDTSFSASEAAQGIEELAKAGVSMADIMGGGARASLDLAAAGAVSVAEAAEIASNAMNVFGLKGADMAHVADTIAGAANASAIGVNDYKFSLAAAGAVAATVGISFDSLSTAIAVMGNAGIKGSDAGTSLKTMLLNLQPATENQVKTFQQLGILTFDTEKAMAKLRTAGIDPTNMSTGAMTDALVRLANGVSQTAAITPKMYKAFNESKDSLDIMKNAFFDANGNAKDFAGIAQVLQDSLKGMTKQQQLATLEIMFGSDAIRAGAVLLEAGAAGFDELAAAMGKVTAKAVAEERLNNLWGSIEKLKGSLETAAIMLGATFLPALKGMVDGMTEGINQGIEIIEQLPDAWRTAGEAFAGAWAPSETLSPFINMVGEAAIAVREQFGPAIATAGAILQQLSGWFTENIAPIAAFVAGFLGAIGTAGLFTAAIAAVTAVLTLLLSPIGLVAIAVGLLAAAWTTNFMGIQEATAAAWAYLLPIFTQIVDWLGPKISAVLTWLTTTGWPMMLAAATAVGDWITGTAIPALTQLVDWLGPKLSAVVTWIYTTGWPSLVTAGETVVLVVTNILKWFTDLFTALQQRGVFTELGTIWTTLVGIGEKLWAIIQKIIDVFTPFKTLGDQFNTGTGAALIGTFTVLAEKAGLTVNPIELISKALSGLFAIISLQLSMVEKFIGYLEKIATFKMPSFNLPGGGGGGVTGPASTMTPLSYQATTSGGFMNNAERLAFVGEMAAKYGHDPATVQRGAMMEGAGPGGPVGDSGMSFGALQAYTGGGMGNTFQQVMGLDPRDPNNEKALVEWQISQLANTGWTPYNGPTKAGGYTKFQGIGTGSGPGRMDRIPLGGGGVGGGVPGMNPAEWPGFMSQVNEQLPDYLMSLDTIQQAGTLAFNGTTQAAVVAGAGLISASTDALGNVTRIYSDATGVIGATITNAGGQIVNSWGTTGAAVVAQSETTTAAVVAQTNLMASGALTSVTNLGTGFLTTVQTTAGTAIATVTDMAGQITSQYATLANGVTLNAGAMQTGVLTATTAMHDGTILSVQDMAGNAIVTVTDMHGQVTNQYTTMAAEGGAVLTEFAALNLEQFGAVAESALKPIEPIENLGSALADIPQADMSDTVKQFGEAAAAAKKAQAAIKALADATEDLPGSFGGSKGGKSSGLSKKAAGGWASGLTLVGEEGPELLSLNRPHYVTPNSALSGGGGPVTVVNVSVGGSLVAQSELEDTIARAVATSLRGGSLAWSN
jgi:hypothetical protein